METLRAILEHPRTARFIGSVSLSQTRNKNGESPLHLAISKRGCAYEASQLLLKHGALVDVADNNGKTPLAWAIEKRKDDVVRLLLEHRAKDGFNAPPLEPQLRQSLLELADVDPVDGPWRAILKDYASQAVVVGDPLP